ncbi:betaine-aldehyde dehydrogenase [Bacillus sp. FJAT-27231]|uniref:aldehyde dehydrogenase family protein n=1 Tax=Bacillus sp. FJAT-27231 TaxID=1679168 RepID=UPI00067139AA|nr:aldehyde dehydrogenase family protein [Bacillus sp. FJAT-27231]KMY52868.1 betaine-aldehyde dehydrogenase [Bacillus sp. FJAT-27231]
MSQAEKLSLIGTWTDTVNLKKLYINGEWTEPAGRETLSIINPATGEEIAEVASANAQDAERAIRAARAAFDTGQWRSMSAHERASLLTKLAAKMEEHQEELAAIETANNGKTLREAQGDIAEAVKTFRYYTGLATKPTGETFETTEPLVSRVVREPIGVCGQIIPWNYPLLMAAWKLAPALAAGNTCILKPSELTPLTAIRLFELIDEVGFPKGVVNLINGTGPNAGQPLVTSSLVDKIAFTGGTVTGKHIIKEAAGNLKKVSLELGGKSPNIIFADANYESALDYAAFAIFNNSGQVCSAGSRLLVEREIYDRFTKDLAEATKKIRVGHGADPSSHMGPVISKQHMEKIEKYIAIGKQEGAQLMCGGRRLLDEDCRQGYFIEPTIFIDVDPSAAIAREEIFGPVLCVIPFDTEEEALNIANDSPYGLAAGIFTSDTAKAERMAKYIRAGVVWINTYEQNLVEGPWGGYKESGIGRELGTYGFDEYTEVKQIINTLKVEPTGWFAD